MNKYNYEQNSQSEKIEKPSDSEDDVSGSMTVNVEYWTKRRRKASLRIAGEMGYKAEIVEDSTGAGYPCLCVQNNGQSLSEFWKKLDDEAPYKIGKLPGLVG